MEDSNKSNHSSAEDSNRVVIDLNSLQDQDQDQDNQDQDNESQILESLAGSTDANKETNQDYLEESSDFEDEPTSTSDFKCNLSKEESYQVFLYSLRMLFGGNSEVFAQFESHVFEQENQLRIIQEEFATLQTKLGASEKSLLELGIKEKASLEQNKQDLENLEQQSTDSQRRLLQLEEEKQELSLQLDSQIKKYKKNKKHFKREIQKLENSLAEAKEELNSIKKQFEEESSEKESLKLQLQEKTVQIESWKLKAQKSILEINKLNEQMENVREAAKPNQNPSGQIPKSPKSSKNPILKAKPSISGQKRRKIESSSDSNSNSSDDSSDSYDSNSDPTFKISPDKPFLCHEPNCRKSFTKSTQLFQHEWGVHRIQNQGYEGYLAYCPRCEKEFRYPQNFDKHLQRITPCI